MDQRTTNWMKGALHRRLVSLIKPATGPRSISSETGFALGSLKGPHRPDNQDRVAVAEIHSRRSLGTPVRIGIVCDGLGGLEEGGAAATTAIAAFLTELVAATSEPIPIHDAVLRAICQANDQVYAQLAARGGTTLTALVIGSDGFAVGGHVGDSRLYRLKRDRSLELMSKDDTVQGVLRDQSDDIDEDDLDNRLLQYVGIGEDISPHIFPVPAYHESFVLTSDGMHGLGRKVLNGLCQNSSSLLDLVRKACFVAEAVGVHDNATIAALSAEGLVRKREFDQLTLRVWTPLDHLELWIGDAFQPSYHVPQDVPADRDAEEHAAPKKAKRRSTGARKTKKESAKLKTDDRAKPEPPQFDIKFGKQ